MRSRQPRLRPHPTPLDLLPQPPLLSTRHQLFIHLWIPLLLHPPWQREALDLRRGRGRRSPHVPPRWGVLELLRTVVGTCGIGGERAADGAASSDHTFKRERCWGESRVGEGEGRRTAAGCRRGREGWEGSEIVGRHCRGRWGKKGRRGPSHQCWSRKEGRGTKECRGRASHGRPARRDVGKATRGETE